MQRKAKHFVGYRIKGTARGRGEGEEVFHYVINKAEIQSVPVTVDFASSLCRDSISNSAKMAYNEVLTKVISSLYYDETCIMLDK